MWIFSSSNLITPLIRHWWCRMAHGCLIKIRNMVMCYRNIKGEAQPIALQLTSYCIIVDQVYNLPLTQRPWPTSLGNYTLRQFTGYDSRAGDSCGEGRDWVGKLYFIPLIGKNQCTKTTKQIHFSDGWKSEHHSTTYPNIMQTKLEQPLIQGIQMSPIY